MAAGFLKSELQLSSSIETDEVLAAASLVDARQAVREQAAGPEGYGSERPEVV
jgi:hypothetical protein